VPGALPGGCAARLSARTCRAALLAAEKRSSHGYPVGRAALRAVIEIIALPPAAIRIASIAMTQSIAGQPAPELAVPLLDRCWGKGTPASHPEGARRAAQDSLFSTSIGAVAATRTEFQLSRRWFKIPAPRMSGSPQSRPHSRGIYVNTRDKLLLDQCAQDCFAILNDATLRSSLCFARAICQLKCCVVS
jgi:hypothetical protein